MMNPINISHIIKSLKTRIIQIILNILLNNDTFFELIKICLKIV